MPPSEQMELFTVENTAMESIDSISKCKENSKAMMDKSRADSLRSVLDYFEANIAASQDSASKSFLTNLAGAPHKLRRRLSTGAMPVTQQSKGIPTGSIQNGRKAPKRVSRRASWCTTAETSSFPLSPMRNDTETSTESSPQPISQTKVRETRALFEGTTSPKGENATTTVSQAGRRSSMEPGVEILHRQDMLINAERFQQMREFWSSLPKPIPDFVPPRYPKRWNSMQADIPQTVRDIALKAATPACPCMEKVPKANCERVCKRCVLEPDVELDDSSVHSSAVCVFDGSNLYLPLPQGCMVFRSSPGTGSASADQMPQRPSRHGSIVSNGLSSTRSISSASSVASIASFSTTPPRRVRFAEENEVWFFEVDDLCSVFSEDGLELAQDFASIFDGGDDYGPRQVRRPGSTGSNASQVPGETAWEYMGFYDGVRLPQNFGSAFMDGQCDSVPRPRRRRSSLEHTTSLLDSVCGDQAPKAAPRRGSIEMECILDLSEQDLDFDHFVPPRSPVRRKEGIHRPVTQEEVTRSWDPCSPTGSFARSPDQAPKAIRRRGSIEAENDGEGIGRELPTLPAMDRSPGPSLDVSPRKAKRRQSIEAYHVPCIPELTDVLRKTSFGAEMDSQTVSTTGTFSQAGYAEEPTSENGKSSQIGWEFRPTRRASMSDFVPMSNFSVKTAMREAFTPVKQNRWIKGEQGVWKKGKMGRRASTSDCLRPTTFRGLSFDKEDKDALLMRQVCADIKNESDPAPQTNNAEANEGSESTVDVSLVTESTDSFKVEMDKCSSHNDLSILISAPKKRTNGLSRYSNHSHDHSRRRYNFLKEHGKLRPGLVRGYSFSDEESIFDDCASLASQSNASVVSSHASLGPAAIHGASFDSYSSIAKSMSIFRR